MVHNAGSSSKTWRTVNNHYLPLSDAQKILYEHKLSRMQMKQGEDPHIFFSQLNEVLGGLLMLGVEKDDRVVCSLMLNELARDYSNVIENIRIMYPRNREAIERHVRDKYLELSIRGRVERQTGQGCFPGF